MSAPFADRLVRAQQTSGSLVCVGLDPDLSQIPPSSPPPRNRFLAFNRRIIDATADLAAAYKPQIAFYSALGRKRNSWPAFATFANERRMRWSFSTPNATTSATRPQPTPRGLRSLRGRCRHRQSLHGRGFGASFLARPDRGAILLCRTSNPGARDFQDLLVDGLPLYRRVAERADRDWNAARNLMLVVGATYPGRWRTARAHPTMWFLVPGIGAQGGDLDKTGLAAGFGRARLGPLD
jgi:orotidine-5'-phosphate decarboxylase